MLHNAPSLDLSSIILFWKKSRKIDHVSWINTSLINMKLNIPVPYLNIYTNRPFLEKKLIYKKKKFNKKIHENFFNKHGSICIRKCAA